MMNGFKTVSLADQVFEKLERDIITGVYRRGEILTELRLVEQLGVSRTPIREALRRLEQERLIRESGKGSVVLGITPEDLVDIMSIRQYVEGLAADYASHHMSDEALRQMEHILELQEFYCEKGDAEHVCQLDDQFHALICQLSGSTVIRDTLLPLHRKTQRFRMLSIQDQLRLQKSVAEHRAIVDALCSGDGREAADRMSDHVKNARENMIARLDYHG